MSSIAIRDVCKSFDGGATYVVREVGIDLPDGEFLTVLGPSGCGKSTLLRMIAGLDEPDSGDILIGGARVNGLDPKDRDIAMVFQNYALYPHLTARENISVAMKLRRMPDADIRVRVDAAADRLGLTTLLDRKPAALSGGQRQRVALARALVRRPKAFLLDEPLSNLDAVLREHTRADLKMLFREIAATVVYVTHDQVEAMTMSDRVAVLNQGRLEQIAAPVDLYRKPATVFVAGFVGSPRMNLIDAALVGKIGDGATTVGVRPEDVYLSAQPGDGTLRMRVKLVETLGAQSLITLIAGPLEIRATAPADQAVADDIFVRIPAGRAHRFGADGRRMA